MDAADLKGTPLAEQVVVVERGPVANFATAINDQNPVFHDATVAAETGFDAIPAPPTYPVVMGAFGAFPELQPNSSDSRDAVTYAIEVLSQNGGMILHGEQELTYHRPVRVGDRLRGTGEIEDVYAKESGSAVMTFLMVRTDWADDTTGDPVCTSRMTIIHRR